MLVVCLLIFVILLFAYDTVVIGQVVVFQLSLLISLSYLDLFSRDSCFHVCSRCVL